MGPEKGRMEWAGVRGKQQIPKLEIQASTLWWDMTCDKWGLAQAWGALVSLGLSGTTVCSLSVTHLCGVGKRVGEAAQALASQLEACNHPISWGVPVC